MTARLFPALGFGKSCGAKFVRYVRFCDETFNDVAQALAHLTLRAFVGFEGGEEVLDRKLQNSRSGLKAIVTLLERGEALAHVSQADGHSNLSFVFLTGLKVEALAVAAKLGRGGELRPFDDAVWRVA